MYALYQPLWPRDRTRPAGPNRYGHMCNTTMCNDYVATSLAFCLRSAIDAGPARRPKDAAECGGTQLPDDVDADAHDGPAPPHRLGGGRGASVWEIATPAGVRAVKVADRERIGREARVHDAIAGCGVAPRLVAAGDGVLVTERIAGGARPAGAWSAADARAVGALLRRLHDTGDPSVAVADRGAAAAIDRAADLLARANDADRGLAARVIAMMPAAPAPRAVLLHGDPVERERRLGDGRTAPGRLGVRAGRGTRRGPGVSGRHGRAAAGDHGCRAGRVWRRYTDCRPCGRLAAVHGVVVRRLVFGDR